jgi:hypothetical protein
MPAVEDLRQKHQVRLVNEQEEGSGVDRLPNGVYGYTYAPGVDQAPLFQQPKFQSFEVHKLADGAVAIVGYVSPEIAAKIEGFEPLKFRLLPEPAGPASTAVALPIWRIGRQREYSARDGQGLEVELIGGKM